MSDLDNIKMMSKDIFERLDGYCIHATSDNTGTVFTIEELYQAFKKRMHEESEPTNQVELHDLYKGNFYMDKPVKPGQLTPVKDFESIRKTKPLKVIPNGVSMALNVLRGAERVGADKDEPEGVRYIVISDTVANNIIDALESDL